jgi:diguanylate cyclase (GGDEF)-like protein/PAS domain S-box-containing protein
MDASTSTDSSETLARQTLILNAILKHLPQGVSVFDEALCLRYWNQPFLDVLELPPDIVYGGVPFEDLIRVPAMRGEYGSGDIEEHIRQRKALALQFQAHRFERTRPNGKTTLVQGVPLHVGERIAGFITTYTDITDRKQAEEQLREQHETLWALIDNLPVGVSLLDKTLHFVAHNKRFIELLEFPDSLFGTHTPSFEDVARFNATRGEYGPVDVEAYVVEACERSKLSEPHHFERSRPNGKELEIRGVPMPAGGFVTIYADITERKAHERDVRQLNEQLEQRVDERTASLSLANVELANTHDSLKTALAEVEAIFEAAIHGIVLLRERKIVRCNRHFQEMTGYSAEELSELQIRMLYASEAAYLDAAKGYDYLKRHNRYQHEQQFRRKNGEIFWVNLSGRAFNPDNPLTGTVWLIADITERKDSEMRLTQTNERLSCTITALENRDRQVSLLNRAHDLLLSCHTREEAFRVVTSVIQKLFPETSGALATYGESQILHAVVRWGEASRLLLDEFSAEDCWAFRQGRPHETSGAAHDICCSHFDRTPDTASICLPLMVQGRIFGSLWLALPPGAAFEQNQRQLLIAFADAIKLSLSNLDLREALREQASRDPLTNLYNRRYLMETLARELPRALRFQRPYSLAILDIDHFKSVNDSYGHDAGDTAIKLLARMLLEETRRSDVVCRYGGEEFVVLLPETGSGNAAEFIEKIRTRLEVTPLWHENQKISSLTLSAGIAEAAAARFDAGTLISMADAALYRAKQDGRNRVIIAPVAAAAD